MGFYHDASLGLAFESASIVQLNTATEMKKVVTYSVMSRLVAKQVVPATKGMLEIQNTRQSPRPFDPTERYRC